MGVGAAFWLAGAARIRFAGDEAGTTRRGIADVGGLVVIIALLAMWIGIVRYTGELDALGQLAEGKKR